MKIFLIICITLSASLFLAWRNQERSLAEASDTLSRLEKIELETRTLANENKVLVDRQREIELYKSDDIRFASLAKRISAVAKRQEAGKRPSNSSPTKPELTAKTATILNAQKIYFKQKQWGLALDALQNLLHEVEPDSFDMAVVLDTKAKILLLTGKTQEALEPLAAELQINNEHSYYDPATLKLITNLYGSIKSLPKP